MNWIKATHRLPKEAGTYFIKDDECGNKVCNYSPESYRNNKNSLLHRRKEHIIWLDESSNNESACGWLNIPDSAFKDIKDGVTIIEPLKIDETKREWTGDKYPTFTDKEKFDK